MRTRAVVPAAMPLTYSLGASDALFFVTGLRRDDDLRRKKLQWYIPVLLWWVLVPFGFQHLQCLDQFLTRFSWLDDRIHKAPFRGHIRIGKAIPKFFNFALAYFFPVRGAF